MFYDSDFAGDVSNWNPINVKNTDYMFSKSFIDETELEWYKNH